MKALVSALLIFATQPALADCTDVCWGAVAIGMWLNNDGIAEGSSGVASNYSTEEEAGQRALAICAATGWNCEVSETFNTGCAFVSFGRNSEGIIAITSDTVSGAYNDCEAQGYDCNAPQGSCVAE